MPERERDQREANDPDSDSPRKQRRSEDEPESQTDRSVIATTDPLVAIGSDAQAEWREHPDATLIAETGHVDRPMPAYLPPTSGSPPERRPQEGPKREDQARDDREKPRPSLWRHILISAGAAFAAGMIGAGMILYFFGHSKSESNQSPTGGQSGSQKKSGSEDKFPSKGSDEGTGADETAQSGSSIPGFTRAEDADTLRKQIEHLSERIDQLGHRLDTQAHRREAVPPDLRTLQIKVGDLTGTMEEVGNLPSRFRRLESRFEDLQQELKMLRDRISAARDEGTGGAAERPVVAISPPMTVGAQPDTAWAEGVALFKSGHYPEASNVFRQLQTTRPTDARVWYYSALAVGMSTGDWSHSARELAERGLKCERAGTPERNQIDVAFTGLTAAQGRDWLNAYRDKINLR